MTFGPDAVFLNTTSSEPPDSHLTKILSGCFSPGVSVAASLPTHTHPIYWDAQAFELEHVKVFQQMAFDEKMAVVRQINEDLMREACFIEMAGMTYTARMSLESVNLEERMLFSTMAAEEASHFALLQPLTTEKNLARGPDDFNAIIAEMIAGADRAQVIFLIQVLLEGWGLNHFMWLAANTREEIIRDIFKTILKDEARHHASGRALLKTQISANDHKVMNWLEALLQMVRVGPVRLMKALENARGSLTISERQACMTELNAETAARQRLQRLERLMADFLTDSALKRLHDRSLFQVDL